MSITRINRFIAGEKKTNELHDFLRSIIPMIKSSRGCEGCRLLQNHDQSGEFIILEEWISIEAHEASANSIPREKIEQVISLLAAPPEGHYYSNMGEE